MTTAHPAYRHAVGVFEKVVVGVRDIESGRDAIALAMELASPRSEFTLAHVYVVTTDPELHTGSAVDAAKRRRVLQRLTALAAEFPIDAQMSCPEALSPRRGLHELASNRHADLLVVSASHRDETGQLLLGDDTSEMLDDAPCAVAVAPIGYYARGAVISRIGVAYNASAESDRALLLARGLAAEHHAELSAFEAVQAPIHVRDPSNADGEVDEHVEKARQRMAALGGLEPEARLGDAVEQLTRYERSVDLLILGPHNYRPNDRLREQTTSQQLAGKPSTPLLVLSATAAVGG